jgi:50S ribosomal protein L16 3-hydroxylase
VSPPDRRPLRRLGTMPVSTFVARYWQRRPLCVRQAFDPFVSPVSRERLFELAGDSDVESRLVNNPGGRWQVRHGPFAASALPPLRRPHWTLLVQGVDLHDAATADLAARFRFLPAARFDDVMISYASDGGGVGPHVDQYDVFLLQAQGRRRWRIARDFDPQLVEGLPLRVLARFRHEQEWVLEPGDLLYLPPGVAHEGVALGESVTISVGFRLPVWQEVIDAWAERQGRIAPRTGRMPDRARKPTGAPACLPVAMVDAAARELRRGAPTTVEARRTLLEHLTEPKPTVTYEPPRAALRMLAFVGAARRRGLRLDLRTRMLYQGRDFGINGELHTVPARLAPMLRRLANDGRLDAAALGALAPGLQEAFYALLHNWYRFGWLRLAIN